MSGLPSIKVLVVLYRKALEEASTITSLAKVSGASRLSLHVRDNSEERQISESDRLELSKHFRDVVIDWDGDNRSLSKVYNDATESISDHDWLVILDDDTHLPANYIDSITEAENCGGNADLALPIVKCESLIVSPGRYIFVKGKHWAQERRGLVPSADVVAVASGMAIRRRYLTEYRRPFDERLSFYGIDTRFCLDYRVRRDAVFVTSATLDHDSALWKPQSQQERVRRFRLLRGSWRTIHRDNFIERAAVTVLAVLTSIKRTVAERDLRYLL